jgi:hypothetical protein
MDLRPYIDPVLGECRWVADVKWYECKPFAKRPKVRLCILVDTFETTSDALHKAREIHRRFDELEMTAKRFGVSRLLSVYNQSWREKAQPRIRAFDFTTRLISNYVVLSLDRLTLYFEDGGLFLGHSIEVRMDLDGTPREAGLCG